MNKSYLPEKHYVPMQISVATLFGGWLAGFWLLGRNYRVFDMPRHVRMMYAAGILLTLVFAALDLWIYIRIGRSYPMPTGGVIGALVMMGSVNRWMGDRILAHETLGAKHHSHWRVVRVVLISIVVSNLVYFPLYFGYRWLQQAP